MTRVTVPESLFIPATSNSSSLRPILPGSFYFPLLGALITSGGRLLLAMIERCVQDAGGTYLCCDTDALIIAASKAGGTVKMPDGTPPIKALSWKEVEGIINRFDSLSRTT